MEEFCSLVEKIAPELEAYLEAQCREIEEKRQLKLEEERRKREEEERLRREEEERLERERLLQIEEQKRREEVEKEELRFQNNFVEIGNLHGVLYCHVVHLHLHSPCKLAKNL